MKKITSSNELFHPHLLIGNIVKSDYYNFYNYDDFLNKICKIASIRYSIFEQISYK